MLFRSPCPGPIWPSAGRGAWILAPRAALLSPRPPWIVAPALASRVTWADYLTSWCLGFPPGLERGRSVRPPAAQSCLLGQPEQLDSERPEARGALRRRPFCSATSLRPSARLWEARARLRLGIRFRSELLLRRARWRSLCSEVLSPLVVRRGSFPGAEVSPARSQPSGQERESNLECLLLPASLAGEVQAAPRSEFSQSQGWLSQASGCQRCYLGLQWVSPGLRN